jgi:methylmalonyl-CoA mutase N-terminal domain/subunit
MEQRPKEIDKKKIEQAYREATTDYDTVSGIPVKEVYNPEDLAGMDYQKDIAPPGEYPFTRGHHPLMYRGKLWNIREISGLSTPRKFNERLKFLVDQGASALDWELDGPTMYGLEPDQPYAEGQLGICGVTLHTLRDVETLCQGIPIDAVSLSVATFTPAVWQSYMLTAKKRGYDFHSIRGVGGAIHYYGPACLPSYSEMLYRNGGYSVLARWSNDFCEYVLKNCPKWNLWFSSSYDFREAGGDAIHEIAFTLAIRNELLREMSRRGVDINVAAKKLSPVFAADRDFFEEIAKLRAARRVWARTLKEEFGVTDPAAMRLRFHIDVSGSNYTRQQPLVNIVRGSLGTLAAVLGGCMGVQTPSYDEAWATPTEEAVTLAIRTQQVIRYESGVTRVADPLGGSYYIESLTNKLEEEILAMTDKIEQMGGWLVAMQKGWVHDQLHEGLLATQKKIESGERVVVGVNRYAIPPEKDFKPGVYAPGRGDVEEYIAEFKAFKEKRNHKKVKETLEKLRSVAKDPGKNLIPYTFEALEADATFPEITGVLRMADGLEYDWAGEREYPF